VRLETGLGFESFTVITLLILVMLDSYNAEAQAETIGDDMVVRGKQGKGNIEFVCPSEIQGY
jgi:hypothetical protein